MMGQSVEFTSSARTYNVDGFIGFDINFNVKDDLEFYTDIEFTKGLFKNTSDNDGSIFGNVGLQYKF